MKKVKKIESKEQLVRAFWEIENQFDLAQHQLINRPVTVEKNRISDTIVLGSIRNIKKLIDTIEDYCDENPVLLQKDDNGMPLEQYGECSNCPHWKYPKKLCTYPKECDNK